MLQRGDHEHKRHPPQSPERGFDGQDRALLRHIDHGIGDLCRQEMFACQAKHIAGCRRFLAQARSCSSYAARYRRLLRGLDGASEALVCRILARAETVARLDDAQLTGRSCLLDLLTPEEAAEMRRCRQEFTNQIIALDQGIFAWRHYLLPIGYFESSVFYYRHQLPHLRRPECLQGRAVLDVGAFVGESALIFREYTDGPIYCFEPQPQNFRALQRTLKLNECRNVVAVPLALGRQPGRQTICMAGSSSVIDPRRSPMERMVAHTRRAQIEVTTLDAFMQGKDLDIGLIKVDIEGFEQEFLAGARETIARHRPVMLLSIYHNAHDFFDIKPMIESWNLGYEFQISRPPQDIFMGETLLICEPQGA